MAGSSLHIAGLLSILWLAEVVNAKVYPAPVYDVSKPPNENLSFSKCGKPGTTNPYKFPWRVAVGGDERRSCVGLLVSNTTFITPNCRELADDFIKDKGKYKGYTGGCYEALLKAQSTDGCEIKDVYSKLLKISSVKRLPSEHKNVDLHVWEFEKEQTKIICLFNKASDVKIAQYYVFDRLFDTTVEAQVAEKLPDHSDEIVVTFTTSPTTTFTFDFLVTKSDGRYFLRGFFFWDLGERLYVFIDMLSVVEHIVHASSSLYMMPTVPAPNYKKIDFQEKFGINKADCGYKLNTEQQRSYRNVRDLGDVVATELIKDGLNAEKGEFPWIVQIKNIATSLTCGGSLVSSRIVVTAAHCLVTSKNATNYIVTAGMLNLASKTENRTILTPSKLLIHQDYKPGGLRKEADLALMLFLEISTDFANNPDVKPICLWDNLFDGNKVEEGEVAGWGLNSNEKVPDNLQKLKLPVHTFEKCYSYHQTFFSKHLQPRKHFCVGQDGSIPCKGDSGGGFEVLQLVNNTNKSYLRGVVGFGVSKNLIESEHTKSCNEAYPVLFTDVAWYVDWIKNMLEEHYHLIT